MSERFVDEMNRKAGCASTAAIPSRHDHPIIDYGGGVRRGAVDLLLRAIVRGDRPSMVGDQFANRLLVDEGRLNALSCLAETPSPPRIAMLRPLISVAGPVHRNAGDSLSFASGRRGRGVGADGVWEPRVYPRGRISAMPVCAETRAASSRRC